MEHPSRCRSTDKNIGHVADCSERSIKRACFYNKLIGCECIENIMVIVKIGHVLLNDQVIVKMDITV